MENNDINSDNNGEVKPKRVYSTTKSIKSISRKK